ncbi:MAG: inositol-3-phosphate synthase [Thermoguttaceae bacterium]|jgi:myo-inositol-1-phosphate synthase
MANRRIGIWLIGAKGGVATTTIVGLVALRQGRIGPTGLVTQLPQFQHLDLPGWDELVVGGHEIRQAPLAREAMRLATQMRVVAPELIDRCRGELDEIDGRIRPGTIYNVGGAIAGLAHPAIPRERSPAAIVDRLKRDLLEFHEQTGAEHVVVVNVASTEPPHDTAGLPPTWEELRRLLEQESPLPPGDGQGPYVSPRPPGEGQGVRALSSAAQSGCPLPASSLYAIAALDLGCSYVNFTPSLGSAPAAIDELARLRGARHAGCDGKTGETLLKSVLAPMFARRNLRVMSWVGHNIFGNMDAQVLADPANKAAKLASKDRLLAEVLGYRPQSHISIEQVESLGDWKTAWDHVHFAGFLGTPMTLQFIWQGCDSVLAAPLVLDLVRLVESARRRGESGLLPFLASFFKSPLGVTEHGFDRQYAMLEEWARLASPAVGNRPRETRINGLAVN